MREENFVFFVAMMVCPLFAAQPRQALCVKTNPWKSHQRHCRTTQNSEEPGPISYLRGIQACPLCSERLGVEGEDVDSAGMAHEKAWHFQIAGISLHSYLSTMILNWDACSVVTSSPEVVSGAPVFRGTRVPVAALFENLEDGATVMDFIQWFPGVTKQQVEAVLEFVATGLRKS